MRFGSVRLAVCAVTWLLASAPASAVFVTSWAALGATDYIDWAQFPLNTYTGTGATFTTAQGATGTVDNFYRIDQGSPPNGYWQANFTPGDALAWKDSGDVINLNFASSVSGAGTQFATGLRRGPFTAELSAYDAGGNLLEMHTLPGELVASFDGSAVFLGLARSQADIAKLAFRVTLPPQGSAGLPAINRVDVLHAAAVPEPAAALLLLLGAPIVVVAGKRWRAR